ncbi:aminotransferase class V-fold PLP-dependent enzyme [Propionivibrio sp.]|uniref:aminotransferase class V-fold PLP-dependent enzyme n=1 Tax=Propionivibrio sp. TaxID=2212460 RepID=UPI0034385A83
MTIPTPTSNGVEGLGGAPLQGLPDEATLGRLASEFFRRLPGSLDSSLGASVPELASATPSAPENRVVAQAFGLPGEGELKSLLAEIASDRQPVESLGQPSTTGNFYFLDAARIPTAGLTARPPFDVAAIRRDFPILQERVNGRPLVWFDNAATTQKPQAVIDRLAYFYAHENSNIHRAAHELAARATDAYESARNKVAHFIGAGSADEVIFVRGATEAINLVAKTWGFQNIVAGDEIVVSLLEHHANIVPWQQLAAEKGARIRVIPVDDSGQILLGEYQKLLNDRTKLVAITQVSNALGTVTDAAVAGRRQHDCRRHLRAHVIPAGTEQVRGRYRQHR